MHACVEHAMRNACMHPLVFLRHIHLCVLVLIRLFERAPLVGNPLMSFGKTSNPPFLCTAVGCLDRPPGLNSARFLQENMHPVIRACADCLYLSSADRSDMNRIGCLKKQMKFMPEESAETTN